MSDGSIAHLLNKTGSLYRRTRISDGQGGFVSGFPDTPIAVVPFRAAMPSASEIEIAQQMQVKITHALFFEPAEIVGDYFTTGEKAVQRGDKIVDEEGIEYKLQFKLPPSAPRFQKWMAQEQQQGN